MQRTLTLCAVLLLMLATSAGGAFAQNREGFFSQFKDPQDGSFDVSAWLAEAHGFLPLVSIITEPAVDYGVAGTLAFFHRPKGWTLEGARESVANRERQQTPSVSAVAGGYTFNNSWFVGGGHMGVWKDDRLRYTGFGGYGSFNLEIAGLTEEQENFSFGYNATGWGLMQTLKWRLSDSFWFIGGTWDLTGLTTEFDLGDGPNVPDTRTESTNGSLGAQLAYDSRDNIFTPNSGISAAADLKRHDTALLGDYDYWDGKVTAAGFVRAGSEWVLGWRAQGVVVGGGAPFWALPFVQMRGVPAMRYLGQHEAQAEAEVRWDWNPRWSAVGFGGWGWTESTILERTSSRSVGAVGGGFRYLLARGFSMRGGIDVAYGPDGPAFYVTMGSAWR